jgi:hypothetical protein
MLAMSAKKALAMAMAVPMNPTVITISSNWPMRGAYSARMFAFLTRALLEP